MQPKNTLKGKKVIRHGEVVYPSGVSGKVGIALAMIKDMEPHYHRHGTEWYIIIKGNGIVYLNGKGIGVKEHDVLKIPPNTVHSAKSKLGMQVYVITLPPWKASDHNVVKGY